MKRAKEVYRVMRGRGYSRREAYALALATFQRLSLKTMRDLRRWCDGMDREHPEWRAD